jgi:hypothetical protein
MLPLAGVLWCSCWQADLPQQLLVLLLLVALLLQPSAGRLSLQQRCKQRSKPAHLQLLLQLTDKIQSHGQQLSSTGCSNLGLCQKLWSCLTC